jgi:hypothetical protein
MIVRAWPEEDITLAVAWVTHPSDSGSYGYVVYDPLQTFPPSFVEAG